MYYDARHSSLCLVLLCTVSLGVGAESQQLPSPRVQFSSAHREAERALPQALIGGKLATRAQLAEQKSGISLASADFDSDGTPDLMTGYATAGGGGALVLQRGSAVATAPTPNEWAMTARGEFVAPFVAKSEVIDLPVRPDLLRAADVLGLGHIDLLTAAKGDTSIYLLSGTGTGTFLPARKLPLLGSVSALVSWRGPKGSNLIAAAVCSSGGCGVQVLDSEGRTLGFVRVGEVISSLEVAGINRGLTQDFLAIAGGRAIVIDGDSMLSAAPVIDTLPVSSASAATAGFFIYSFGTGVQIAVLGSDATLHILSRSPLNPRQLTHAELLANRRKAGPAAMPARTTGMPWIEVESTPNFGPGAEASVLVHGHFSGSGQDDIVLMGGSQYVQLSHFSESDGAIRKSTPYLTVDATSATVTAALPARVSASARMGMIAANGLRPLTVVAPSPSRTMTVNTTLDAVPSVSTEALCKVGAPGCMLRSAIAVANADAGTNGFNTHEDLININAGTYQYTANNGSTLDSFGSINQHFNLEATMTLSGAGVGSTIIDAQAKDKIFQMNVGVVNASAPDEIFLSNMTIENGLNPNNPSAQGASDSYGGAMDWDSVGTGFLTLNNVIVTASQLNYGPGGGIYLSDYFGSSAGAGTFEMDNSTVSSNKTPEQGGGLYVGPDVPLILSADSFTSNQALASVFPSDSLASGMGGGIITLGNAQSVIDSFTGVTFSGNQATEDGGGADIRNGFSMSGSNFTSNNGGGYAGGLFFVSLDTAATVTTSTFTGNTASTEGGGICVALGGSATSDTFNLQYSRIHGNTGGTHTGLATGCNSVTGAATVNATNNWWGCNVVPTTTGQGCDVVGATAGSTAPTTTVSPFTKLDLTLNNTTPGLGVAVVATASFGQNSAATPTVYTAAQDLAYLAAPISAFTLTGAGTVTYSPSATAFSSSAAPSVSSAAATASGSAASNGSASVTVDGVTVSVPFILAIPDMTVASSHVGSFKAGDTADTYSLTATNSGTLVSSGAVTVVDTLPSGFTATALSGTGWTCTLGTLSCTRSDGLATGASYPAITLTVSVSSADIGSYSNAVSVSGGGEVNTGNDTGSDSTAVIAPPTFGEAFSPSTVAPNIASTVTFTLGNPAANPVTLTSVGFNDVLPSGLKVTLPAASTTCTSGTVTAANGGSSISLSGASLVAGATCTVSVSVASTSIGTYTNTAGPVTASNSNAGLVATATLTVSVTPTKLVYTASPATPITAGGNAGSISVAIEDGAGNIATNSSATVGLTVTGPNGYSASYSTSASNGIATFNLSSVALTAAGTYTYTASGTGLTSASTTGTVNPGAFASLSGLGPASLGAPGSAGSVTIIAQDSFGNTVTSFTGTVTLTSTDSTATLPSPYTYVAGDAGSHVFTYAFNTAGTYTLTKATGAFTATQTGISVGDAILAVNPNGSLSRLTNTGAATSPAGGYTGGGAPNQGVAVDASGNIFSVNKTSSVLAKFSKTGTALSGSGYTGGGVNAPTGVAVDGLSRAWISNGNGSVSAFSNTGTALSPAGGYAGNTSSATAGIVVDQSGNVWVSSPTDNAITEILGAAAPAGPLATSVKNVTAGTRP